ncbi:hypothetical protein CPT_Moabite_066 [Serratia phage Moabite]|uniref:Uncharacterized protein n=1 Tax=Serratia phage Moabite TaxID=2587814 RepID=A0A4Y5TP06_9CAUD|nr:hypothetical protein HWC48_gp066 [Serratia phage Moabite]QDB71098.1 hypothetical protein CPT_Moabite_066 [Serratia phage Moabite]
MKNKEYILTVKENVIRVKLPGETTKEEFVRKVSKEIRKQLSRVASKVIVEGLTSQLPEYLGKYYQETEQYNYAMLSAAYNLSLYVIPIDDTQVELKPVIRSLGACRGYITYKGQKSPFILMEGDSLEEAVTKVHRRLATKIKETNFPEDLELIESGLAKDSITEILSYFANDGERGSTIEHPCGIILFIE